MTAPEGVEDLIRRLGELLAKSEKPVSRLPWSVKPSDGKPIIAGARGGNLFRGHIATWEEAEFAAGAANAIPTLLAALAKLTAEREALQPRVGELEAGLRPFAEAANEIGNPHAANSNSIASGHATVLGGLNLGHLRHAAHLLKGSNNVG